MNERLAPSRIASSQQRAGKVKRATRESLSVYHYYFIFRQTIILRSTPHAADWISEGSLHDHNIPSSVVIHRCAAPFDLSAFGSCNMHETLRVSEVIAARAVIPLPKLVADQLFPFGGNRIRGLQTSRRVVRLKNGPFQLSGKAEFFHKTTEWCAVYRRRRSRQLDQFLAAE